MKIDSCPRCGGEHEVERQKLTRPMAPKDLTPMVWDHWWMCPTLNEPVMSGTWWPMADGTLWWPDV